MSDSSAHSLPYVTREVAGQTVKFGKLTPRERSVILRRLKDERKAKLREHMEGLPPEQRFTELEAFEDETWGNDKWIGYLNTPEGQADVLTLAYQKHQTAGNVDAALDAVEQADGDLILLIGEVCNIAIVRKGEPANPPKSPPANPETTGTTN